MLEIKFFKLFFEKYLFVLSSFFLFVIFYYLLFWLYDVSIVKVNIIFSQFFHFAHSVVKYKNSRFIQNFSCSFQVFLLGLQSLLRGENGCHWIFIFKFSHFFHLIFSELFLLLDSAIFIFLQSKCWYDFIASFQNAEFWH